MAKNQQNIFQTCVPSIFDAKMVEQEPLTHFNQEYPIIKVLHLRESLFLVAHINGLLALVDFEQPEADGPIDCF